MNARIVAVGVVAASVLTLAGCGTIANICLEDEQTHQVPMHVYGGLEADLRFMEEDDPSSRGKQPSVDPFKIVYLTTDLPLSFVADTVTLPLTLPMAYLEKESHRTNPFPRAPTSGPTSPPPAPSTPPASPAGQEPAANGAGNQDFAIPPGFSPVHP